MNIEQLSEQELETVQGGVSAFNAFTCDVAGGLSGGLVGIVGTAAFGPVGGIIGGVFAGSAVKQLCLATIE